MFHKSKLIARVFDEAENFQFTAWGNPDEEGNATKIYGNFRSPRGFLPGTYGEHM